MNLSRHAMFFSAAAVAIATLAGSAFAQNRSGDAWDLALSGREPEAGRREPRRALASLRGSLARPAPP